MTKILKWNSSQINVDEFLPHWFNWLPVFEDVDESPYVYGYLCDLVEGNHPVVLGQNNANLPKVNKLYYRNDNFKHTQTFHFILRLFKLSLKLLSWMQFPLITKLGLE